jgi:hypothetical protein
MLALQPNSAAAARTLPLLRSLVLASLFSFDQSQRYFIEQGRLEETK